MAALWEGFRFIGCELGEDHYRIAAARIEYASKNPPPEDAPKITELEKGQGTLWS